MSFHDHIQRHVQRLRTYRWDYFGLSPLLHISSPLYSEPFWFVQCYVMTPLQRHSHYLLSFPYHLGYGEAEAGGKGRGACAIPCTVVSGRSFSRDCKLYSYFLFTCCSICVRPPPV